MLTSTDLNNLLNQFIDYLIATGASRATVKNYASDLGKVFAKITPGKPVTSVDLYFVLEELKKSFSEATVRRFGYSLKSFVSWAKSQNCNLEVINEVVSRAEAKISPVENYLARLHGQGAPKSTVENYTKDLSRFFFWAKPSAKSLAEVDGKTVNKLSTLDIKRYINYLKSKSFSEASITRYLFSLKDFFKYNKKQVVFDNNPVKPGFLNQNTSKQPRWKRLIKYRPYWWHAYRGHPISDYLNWAALATVTLFIGLGLYQNLFVPKSLQLSQNNNGIVLGSTAPPRILSFQGRLTSDTGTPIVAATNVVFKIYDDRTLGGGHLKWTSKTWSVTPDANGIFSVCLGGQDTTDDCLLNGVADTVIPANLFTDNPSLYLGITVGGDSEASPRQRIASSTYALNAGALNSSFSSATDNDFGNSISATNASTAGTVTVNGINITAVGTATTGTNNTNSINFPNVTTLTNNNFYGLNFGTGYNDILRYNGTQLISGAGKFQNAALDSTVNYSSITQVGTLTGGATGAGFTVALGTSTITGTLGTSNGGTNTSSIGGAGTVVYSNGTSYAFSATTVSSGQCLLSGASGTGQPTWSTCPGGSTRLDQILAATATPTTIDSTTFNQTWNWSGLIAQRAFTLDSTATGLTTGGIFGIGSSTTAYNHGAAETGSLATLTVKDVTSGAFASTTNGLIVSPEINITAGAATKTINGISVNPTFTACTTATCNVNGLNIATVTDSGNFNGTAINIGTGWDTALQLSGVNTVGATDATTFSSTQATTGTIFTINPVSSVTLSTPILTGLAVDLSNNYTTFADGSYTGLHITTPDGYSNSLTKFNYGLNIDTGSGTNITSTLNTTTYTGVNITLPGITQTGGTISSSGVSITIPTGTGSITTGGTINGIYIPAVATGPSVGTINELNIGGFTTTTSGGTVNGINIGSVGTSGGTDTAINIGAGWDTGINFGNTGASNGWASGTLISNSYPTASTSQTAAITGVNMNFGTNLTALSGSTITGFSVSTPALTQTTTATTTFIGYNLPTAGGLAQSTAAGTINWSGVALTLPVINVGSGAGTIRAAGLNLTVPNNSVTQSTGLSALYGLNISGANFGTFSDVTASGTLTGINISGISTPGGATETAIDIGTGWDYGITLPLAGTAALNFSDTGGTAAGGILFGADTTLYRSVANTLKTDDNFIVNLDLTVTGNDIIFGNAETISNITNGLINLTNGTNTLFSFNTGTGAALFGLNESINGSITLYSSGAGITDPTIAADATGSLILAGAAGDLTIGQAGTATNLVFLESSYISASTGKTINIGDGTNVVTFNFDRNNTTYNFKNVKSNGTTAITLDSGTTGDVNIGTGTNAKAISIGNSAYIDTLSYATGNVSGTGLQLSENSITSGIGLWQEIASLTTGTGVLINQSNGSPAFTSGNMLDVELNNPDYNWGNWGANATVSGNVTKFRESLYTSGATITRTGNTLNVQRLYSSDGTGTTNVSGAIASISSSVYTLASSPGTVSENILSLSEGLSFSTGAVLNISNSGSGADIKLNKNDSIIQTPAPAANAVRTLSFNNSAATPVNLLQIRDLTGNSTQFGSLVLADAFVGRQSYSGDEFTKFRTANTDNTTNTNTNAADRRGDLQELSTSSLAGAATVGSCVYSSSVNGTNATNGNERISATGTATPVAVGCLETNSNGTAGQQLQIFNSGNFPQIQMKVRPSFVGASTQRVYVGISNKATATTGGWVNTDRGFFFSNCSQAVTPTCTANGWYGYVADGTTNPPNSVACAATAISTTNYSYLRIEIRKATAGTTFVEVQFFVDYNTTDGIQETSCGSITTTTNNFAASTTMGTLLFVSSGNATAESLDIDYFRVWQDDAPSIPQNNVSSIVDGGLIPANTIVENNTTFTSLQAGQTPVDVTNQELIKNGQTSFVTLDQNNNLTATISAGAKFVWKNSSGQVISWVTDTGEALFAKVTALVGDFGKLVFGEAIVKKSAQTAGQGSFSANDTEVVIPSDKVKDDSLISLTPISKTGGVHLYIKEIKAGESFTVGLERDSGDQPNEATASASGAIKFSWFILNQE